MTKDWTGRLVWIDLGMGQWVLMMDDGTRLPLSGAIDPSLKGRRIRVSGTAEAQLGFGLDGQRTIVAQTMVEAS